MEIEYGTTKFFFDDQLCVSRAMGEKMVDTAMAAVDEALAGSSCAYPGLEASIYVVPARLARPDAPLEIDVYPDFSPSRVIVPLCTRASTNYPVDTYAIDCSQLAKGRLFAEVVAADPLLVSSPAMAGLVQKTEVACQKLAVFAGH